MKVIKHALILTVGAAVAVSTFAQQTTTPDFSGYTDADRTDCLNGGPTSESEFCRIFASGLVASNEATKKAKAEEQRRIQVSKPDASTPRFNECVNEYRANYAMVTQYCMDALNSDKLALRGWFGSNVEAANSAQHHADERIGEMKRVADEMDKLAKEWMIRRLPVRKGTFQEQELERAREAVLLACAKLRADGGPRCDGI